MLSYIKNFESKLDAVEAQRKKDLEKAEAQKRSLELKVEVVEAQGRSLELKVEAIEAQRKKDLENAEAQRKKAIEKLETQREKDTLDVNDRTHKLKLDLEGKIECLERRASERDLEQKQVDEATKRYINSLAEDVEATTDFLAVGVCLLYFRSYNLVSHIST